MTKKQHRPRFVVTTQDADGGTQQHAIPLRCTDMPENDTVEYRAGYRVSAELSTANVDELRQKAHLFGFAVNGSDEVSK